MKPFGKKIPKISSKNQSFDQLILILWSQIKKIKEKKSNSKENKLNTTQ